MFDTDKIWFKGLTILFFVLAVVLVGTVITGCSSKCEECKSNERVVISTDVVEKKVPVGCQFPEIECDFKAEGFGVTEQLLKCIKIQKELIENCKADITKWKE